MNGGRAAFTGSITYWFIRHTDHACIHADFDLCRNEMRKLKFGRQRVSKCAHAKFNISKFMISLMCFLASAQNETGLFAITDKSSLQLVGRIGGGGEGRGRGDPSKPSPTQQPELRGHHSGQTSQSLPQNDFQPFRRHHAEAGSLHQDDMGLGLGKPLLNWG